MNADPVIRANQVAGIKAYTAQPHVKAALAIRVRKAADNMSDEAKERRRQHGLYMAATVFNTPETRAYLNSPEVRADAGRKRTDTVLADIPPAYRERYRFLKASKLMRAAEARQLILDEVAADERRRLAAMSPHERQLERVRNGATLVRKVRIPGAVTR